MRFEFATAGRILFGPGRLQEAGKLAADLGRHALIVTGRTSDRAAPLLEQLEASGMEAARFAVAGEPTLETIRQGVEAARQAGCDLVIGMGGGSALDTGKAIAALLANGGDPLDYVEIIGAGKPLLRPSLPYLAIPTTAGTGAEVTRNAVLGVPEHRIKVSLRSLFLLPRAALVDPELTYSLPPDVTAATGMDALTQLIEPFVCNRANPFSDALCREGMPRAARSLRRACEDGSDTAAREDMALASLFGGLALANAGLGAVHGFAGPIGGRFPAPHGAVCAALIAPTMGVNLEASRRTGNEAAVARYAAVAQLLTASPAATPAEGVAWVRNLVQTLNI